MNLLLVSLVSLYAVVYASVIEVDAFKLAVETLGEHPKDRDPSIVWKREKRQISAETPPTPRETIAQPITTEEPTTTTVKPVESTTTAASSTKTSEPPSTTTEEPTTTTVKPVESTTTAASSTTTSEPPSTTTEEPTTATVATSRRLNESVESTITKELETTTLKPTTTIFESTTTKIVEPVEPTTTAEPEATTTLNPTTTTQGPVAATEEIRTATTYDQTTIVEPTTTTVESTTTTKELETTTLKPTITIVESTTTEEPTTTTVKPVESKTTAEPESTTLKPTTTIVESTTTAEPEATTTLNPMTATQGTVAAAEETSTATTYELTTKEDPTTTFKLSTIIIESTTTEEPTTTVKPVESITTAEPETTTLKPTTSIIESTTTQEAVAVTEETRTATTYDPTTTTVEPTTTTVESTTTSKEPTITAGNPTIVDSTMNPNKEASQHAILVGETSILALESIAKNRNNSFHETTAAEMIHLNVDPMQMSIPAVEITIPDAGLTSVQTESTTPAVGTTIPTDESTLQNSENSSGELSTQTLSLASTTVSALTDEIVIPAGETTTRVDVMNLTTGSTISVTETTTTAQPTFRATEFTPSVVYHPATKRTALAKESVTARQPTGRPTNEFDNILDDQIAKLKNKLKHSTKNQIEKLKESWVIFKFYLMDYFALGSKSNGVTEPYPRFTLSSPAEIKKNRMVFIDFIKRIQHMPGFRVDKVLNSWEKVKKILDSYPGSDADIINEAKERKSLIATITKIPYELQKSTSLTLKQFKENWMVFKLYLDSLKKRSTNTVIKHHFLFSNAAEQRYVHELFSNFIKDVQRSPEFRIEKVMEYWNSLNKFLKSYKEVDAYHIIMFVDHDYEGNLGQRLFPAPSSHTISSSVEQEFQKSLMKEIEKLSHMS